MNWLDVLIARRHEFESLKAFREWWMDLTTEQQHEEVEKAK